MLKKNQPVHNWAVKDNQIVDKTAVPFAIVIFNSVDVGHRDLVKMIELENFPKIFFVINTELRQHRVIEHNIIRDKSYVPCAPIVSCFNDWDQARK